MGIVGIFCNTVVCPHNNRQYKKLYYFYGCTRHFPIENYYVGNKIKFKNYQQELNIKTNKHAAYVSNLPHIGFPFSETKKYILDTEFMGRTVFSKLEKHFLTSCIPSSYDIISRRSFFVSKHIQKYEKDVYSDNSNGSETEFEELENEEYDGMVKRMLHLPEMGHQVLVVQPYVKWGSTKKRNTTPELQLAEAVSLIATLPKWKVVDKMKVSLQSLEKKSLFGSGNLEMLRKKIWKDKQITAVFVSVDILRGIQHRELEAAFRVPVYDRYMVVIQIFREHAISREAKLQVAMAEIPYLRMRIKGLREGTTDHTGSGMAAIGGAGETYIETRRRILDTREMKLKNMLAKVRNQRSLLRSNRQKLEYPVVAVVGYTNSGKTSLIKALTGETTMQPKDHLFATLDVTVHAGTLPSYLKVLYVDTVGFISDIPSNLIESFVATLEDAMLADVIVHVYDVSHPDAKAQAETVTKTLEGLNLSPQLLENIVIAGNKVDLLSQNTPVEDLGCNVFVSALTHQGLDNLTMKIEKAILKATGRLSLVLRVPSGGEEVSWLYKQATVTEVKADPKDSQYLLMRIIISEAQFKRFQHNFIKR